MLKTALSHPPTPSRTETRPFPGFVLGSSKSSTDRGEKSRSWPAQGWGGEMVGYASGFDFPAASLQRKERVLARSGREGEIGRFGHLRRTYYA